MRQIELAAQALARILTLAKGGKRDEAIGLFDEAYKPIAGVSGKVVATLDEEQLLTLLTSGSAPDPRRLTVAIELLVTEADLRAEAGEEQQAAGHYRRALGLTAYLAGHLGRLPDGDLPRKLADRAGMLALTPAQRLHLARLHEALGQYGDAEDVLFELLDDDPAARASGSRASRASGSGASRASGSRDDTTAIDHGIAFYQRLLAKDDAELEAGNLPRDEVRSALAELLRRQVQPAD
jgi:tetratricopeptide (TPR) repeat protein